MTVPAVMPGRLLELAVTDLALITSGVDQVVYRFAPDPGEPARPMARIASGAEPRRSAPTASTDPPAW